jgi:hypothetical protein
VQPVIVNPALGPESYFQNPKLWNSTKSLNSIHPILESWSMAKDYFLREHDIFLVNLMHSYNKNTKKEQSQVMALKMFFFQEQINVCA